MVATKSVVSRQPVAGHAQPNVWIDLSGWSPKYFPPHLVQYANTLLKDRILFGSDWPFDPDRPLDERLQRSRFQTRSAARHFEKQRDAVVEVAKGRCGLTRSTVVRVGLF